jgi:hypothetical protein
MCFSHHPPQRWHVPMRGRDRAKAHRVSTPLELFFDLSFVVAVAAAAAAMHHELAAGHVVDRVVTYMMVLLRHLVGVDELHVVRIGLRLRRRPVSAADVRPDGRSPHHRRGRNAGIRGPRHQR